jgi:hypothetical protein
MITGWAIDHRDLKPASRDFGDNNDKWVAPI